MATAHAVADFDGDGLLDLATPNQNGAEILLQQANPPRTFLEPRVLEVGGAVLKALAAADFDLDGRVDQAIGQPRGDDSPNRMWLAYGDGEGGLELDDEPYVLGGVWQDLGKPGLRVTDFNGDGYPDIAAPGAGGPFDIVFLVNDRSGGFQPAHVSVPSPTFSVGAGQLGADGVTDFVVATVAGIEVWERPAPLSWRQVLRDMPAAEVQVVESDGGEALLEIHQATQEVESAQVYVRLVGEGVEAAQLTLEAPGGQRVTLPRAVPRSPSAVTVDVGASVGRRWQPQGYWRLHVTEAGGGDARVTDFEVRTVGRFNCGAEEGGEVCNGHDDDCDGVVDDDAPCDGALECYLGECRDCGQAEECDGANQDCDGRVDEGVRNACGACGPPPAEICNDGDDDCDGEVDEAPVDEVCNGVDDDCDDGVDEEAECPGDQRCVQGRCFNCRVEHFFPPDTVGVFERVPHVPFLGRLEVGSEGPGGRWAAYASFIPPEGTVGDCRLRMRRVGRINPQLPLQVKVHLVEAAWNPRTTTWLAQPAAAEVPIATFAAPPLNQYFEVDLGDVCARWAEAPDTNFGVKFTFERGEGIPEQVPMSALFDPARWLLPSQEPGCE